MIKNMNLKPLSLLFAGALLGIIGGLFREDIKPYLIYIIILVFILILFGSGFLSIIWHEYIIFRRNNREFFKYPIGILNDMSWDLDKDISSYTNITNKIWANEIDKYKSKAKIKLKLINCKKEFMRYIAIINPYGGVYPELDEQRYYSFNKIFEYVKEGGIFINVADIPGYYEFNLNIKRRLDTTPPVYDPSTYASGRPFAETPFMRRLGLQVLNVESNQNINHWDVQMENIILKIPISRVVKEEKNIKSIVSVKDNVTPFFNVTYGKGMFLMFLGSDGYLTDEKVRRFIINNIFDCIENKYNKINR